ncbi:MAG: hypothetical protein APF80_01700 [Alphaproteobacteria bacterium BRH_c36]|nr:MAG: hypothetical protein APF80_01700 [Alphaproteobacteria bacterium BRH_c36]
MATDDSSSDLNRMQRLSGVEKATILLLAMGKPLADRIVKRFDSDELKRVASSASTLRTVERPVLDRIVDDLVKQLEVGIGLVATPGQAQELISGVVSEEDAAQILETVNGSSGKTLWPRLSRTPGANVAKFLMQENSQTVAYVLSMVAPDLAASVVAQMPAAQRNSVMRRMLALKPMTDAAAALLEEILAENLLSGVTSDGDTNLQAKLASVLNKLEKQQMDEALKSIEAVNPKGAKLVRGLLFVFDDIVKLAPEARAKLFDEVPSEVTIMALKDAQPEVVEAALGGVSSRARRMIEQELTGGAPATKKDVQKAQRWIADLVLDMADRGLIEIGGSHDE